MLDPRLGLGRPVLVKGIGRAPQVFEHVYDVEHDRDRGAHLARRALDPPELVALPADEHYPPAPMVGVATMGLGDRIVDHALGGRPRATVPPSLAATPSTCTRSRAVTCCAGSSMPRP
jgi:hypothetical protein